MTPQLSVIVYFGWPCPLDSPPPGWRRPSVSRHSEETYRSSELARQQAACGHQQLAWHLHGNLAGVAASASERAGSQHMLGDYGRQMPELRSQPATAQAAVGDLPLPLRQPSAAAYKLQAPASSSPRAAK